MDLLADLPALNVHHVTFADIAIVVIYKPWFMPFHREKVFRFVSHVQTDAHLHWYSQTLDHPAN